MKTRLIAAALVAALAAPAVLTSAASSAPGESERLSFATYRERARGITLLVDAYPASLHARDPFVPIPIALGSEGAREPIRITLESFELIDGRGNASAPAGYSQLVTGYEKRTFDESLFRVRPLSVGSQFGTSRRLASQFFPAPGRATRTTSVELSPFTWFRDVIYFHTPKAGLGGVLTLRLTADGSDQPLDVRFHIPERP